MVPTSRYVRLFCPEFCFFKGAPLLTREALTTWRTHSFEYCDLGLVLKAHRRLELEDKLGISENARADLVLVGCVFERCKDTGAGGTGGSCK